MGVGFREEEVANGECCDGGKKDERGDGNCLRVVGHLESMDLMIEILYVREMRYSLEICLGE